jgi:hypothetical protein
MENITLDYLKTKYKDRCKTESENKSVLLVYSYILEKENVDSDWWNEDYGCNDVVYILERNFSELDWKLLEIDIENWSIEQIELFIQSIINGDPGYGLFEDIKAVDLLKRYTLEKRLWILSKISKKDDNTIWNNLHYFDKFPYIPFEYINEIALNIGYYDYLLTDWKDSIEMKTMKELIEKSIK